MQIWTFRVVILLCDFAASQPKSRIKGDATSNLKRAIETQNDAEAIRLIENGADINALDESGKALIYLASELGREMVVETLIKHGSNVNIKNKLGSTPLHQASFLGHESVVVILLKNKADVNARRGDRWSPLHVATFQGLENIVEILLKNGADVNARQGDGWSPLHWASFQGRGKLVETLLKSKADVNARRNDGFSAIHVATLEGHDKIVETLLKNGADVNALQNDGWTALNFAVLHGRDNIVYTLLKNGADVNARQNDGWTALYQSALHGRDNILETLLENGANVNAIQNDGWTALHQAASNGRENFVEILLGYGADHNIRNNDGKSARDLANEKGFKKIVDLLDNAPVLLSSASKLQEQYSTEDLIDGSEKAPAAEQSEFPWMAALGYLDQNSLAIEFKCSGTIISDQLILTAAHCIAGNKNQWPSIVRLGALNLTDPNGENYHVENVFRHQNYSMRTKQNDIALIRVSSDIIFGSNIRPACVETDLDDLSSETLLKITSWESHSAGRRKQIPKLREAQVVTMPLLHCNEKYLEFSDKGNHSELKNGISESQYCAFDPNGKSNVGRGDSGGPLQYLRKPRAANIVGIASFGVADATLPSIYTRVAHYADWIAEHIWPDSQK